ncbi:MAG: small multi-drug export protein [Ruminococcaceae bacterium]|nr:small multi-drug export protein [Oscillospiraceae bacterium]
MAETIADYLVGVFQGKIPEELIVFIISMLPVVELRGGMIAAKLLDVEFIKAFVICYVGNILPIPFILLFIRRIFAFLKRFTATRKLVEKLETSSLRKSDKIKKSRVWGLLTFVAIPLPGTGGWTGSLIAALLDMRIKISFPVIALGVLIANLIMSVFSYGLLGAIGL